MNKALPWSIKGVDFDAREAAKEAARRAGQSLGDWLNGAIAEQAADMGLDADEMDEDGQLEAVAARLARLSDRIPESAARLRRGERPMRKQGSRSDAEEDDEIFPVRRARRPSPRIEAREATFSRAGPKAAHAGRREEEDLLEKAIHSLERRRRGEDDDANANANAALRRLTGRLAEIEQKLTALPAETNDPVRHSLARLEQRVEEFGRNAPNEGLADILRQFDEKLSGIAACIDSVKPAPVSSADFERLETRIEQLASRTHSSTNASPSNAEDRLAKRAKLDQSARESVASTQRPESLNRGTLVSASQKASRIGLDAAVAAIARRQVDLDAGPDRPIASSDPQRRQADESSDLKRDVAALAERFESLRREIVHPQGPWRSDPVSSNTQIEPLREELKALSRSVEGLAPRADLQSVAAAIQDLDQKISAGAVALNPETLRRIQTQAQEIRNLLAAAVARPHPSFDTLDNRLTDIAERIERMRPEPAASAEINARLDGLRSALDKSAPDALVRALETRLDALSRKNDPAPTQQETAQRLSELNQHLESVHKSLAEQLQARTTIESNTLQRLLQDVSARIERPAAAIDNGRLESLLREVTDKLDRPSEVNPPAIERALQNVEHKLDQIAERSMTESSALQEAVRDLSSAFNRPGEIPSADVQRLEELLRDIGSNLQQPNSIALEEFRRLDDSIRELGSQFEHTVAHASPDTRALENMIRALADKIDSVERRAAEPLELAGSLVHQVRDLADRIEAVREGDGGAGALEALQDQIRLLSDRLESSDAGLRAMAQIERSMSGLFAHLSETRHSALEIAHAAARDVATEMLSEATRDELSPAIEQDVIGLRQAQQASDKRMHQTLSAVHETLEKMVDRLAAVEQDVVDARSRGRKQGAVENTSAIGPDAYGTLASGFAPVFVPSSPEPSGSDAAPDRRTDSNRFADRADDRPGSLRNVRPRPVSDHEEVLIEPGSGFAPRREEGDEDTTALDARSQRSRFIAAARRAMKSDEQTGAEPRQRAKTREDLVEEAKERARVAAARLDAETDDSETSGAVARLRAYFERRKRPILYGLAAAVLALCSLQAASVLLSRRSEPARPPGLTRSENHSLKRGQEKATPPHSSQSGALIKAPGRSEPKMGALSVNPAKKERTGSLAADSVPFFASQADSQPTGSIPTVNRPQLLAMTRLRAAARGGNRLAQYELATRYAEGRGLVRNPGLSEQWFEKAAQQGLAPAEYRLGVIYEKGIGVAPNTTIAKKWYRLAADAGHIRAMHNLAVMIAQSGPSGKPDYASAARWFHKAAEFGVRDSQYNLAILYARGLGVKRDLTQSYVWFALAAAQGDADAGKKRDQVGAMLDPKRLAEAKARVAAFRPRPETVSANEVARIPGEWSSANGRAVHAAAGGSVSGV